MFCCRTQSITDNRLLVTFEAHICLFKHYVNIQLTNNKQILNSTDPS